MPKAKTKPFRVNADWLYYAHNPGAESDQPTAKELMDLPEADGAVLIPPTRPDLVKEVISVAELYTYGSSVQDDDRLWFRSYPANLIRRGREWLRAAGAEK